MAALMILVFALTAQSRTAEPNKLTDKVEEGEPVPSPLTFSSKFERIVIVRMTYGTDMLAGLVKAVKQEEIKNAVILSGIGSLTSYHVHVVSNTTFPSKNRSPMLTTSSMEKMPYPAPPGTRPTYSLS